MLPADRTLAPGTEPEFPVLRELADTIWRQHYAGIISAAQIDYMLAGRFGDEVLRKPTQVARCSALQQKLFGSHGSELVEEEGD